MRGSRLSSSPTARSSASEGPSTSPLPTARTRQPYVVSSVSRRRRAFAPCAGDGGDSSPPYPSAPPAPFPQRAAPPVPPEGEPVDASTVPVTDLDLHPRSREAGVDDAQP